MGDLTVDFSKRCDVEGTGRDYGLQCCWRLRHEGKHRFTLVSPEETRQGYLIIDCRHVSDGYAHAGALCSRCATRVRSVFTDILRAIEAGGEDLNVQWVAEQIEGLSSDRTVS